MQEPSRPGAADRLTPNDPSGLQRRLTAILQASPAPTVCAARTREDGGDLMVAGGALLEQVRHRTTALQRAGMRRGDVLASDAIGVSRVIDALASILAGFVYWPCGDQRRLADGPLVSDSGAPLIWRPNPLVGVGLSPGLAHEPPAAMPMRLSIQVRDLMAPAGPQVMNNWGVAIILLTVLIKLAFFPLSAASYRSMGKMRVVAPKLEKIKQQYGDDRERLHKAMMELYKTEKINPLGGCLPVLIQIPVFIALYWAILASVELRYAPFFGWITDLSATDPYYVLPVIMGISMYVQSKLNPVPPDPLQAKMMQIMPIAFSVVFFFFPAGLVLYSIVNNVLSIAQQWYITRGLQAAAQAESKGVAKNR